MSAAFFENIFNKQQCGFRKGYNTLQCLQKMLEQRQTISQWRQINALAGIAPFTNMNKRRILMNSFFRSQFNYCPLIWMCHSRTNNRKINRLHERCLRIICNDKQSSFIKLLEKDNSVSKHQRNLQILAIEMFKVSNGLSPVLMNDIFKLRGEQTYNLRKLSQFYRPKVNSV